MFLFFLIMCRKWVGMIIGVHFSKDIFDTKRNGLCQGGPAQVVILKNSTLIGYILFTGHAMIRRLAGQRWT